MHYTYSSPQINAKFSWQGGLQPPSHILLIKKSEITYF